MIAGTTESTAAYIKAHLDEDLELIACCQPARIEPSLLRIDSPSSRTSETAAAATAANDATLTTLILQVVSVKDVSQPLHTRLREMSQCIPEQSSLVSDMFDEIPQEENKNDEDKINDSRNDPKSSNSNSSRRGWCSSSGGGSSSRYLSLILTDGFRRVMAIEHRNSLLRKASILLPAGVALGAKLQLTLAPNAVKVLPTHPTPCASASVKQPSLRSNPIATAARNARAKTCGEATDEAKGQEFRSHGQLCHSDRMTQPPMRQWNASEQADRNAAAAVSSSRDEEDSALCSMLLRLHGDNTVLLGGCVPALQMYTALLAQRQLQRSYNRMSLLPVEMEEEKTSSAIVTVHEVDDDSTNEEDVREVSRSGYANKAATTAAANASRISTRTWNSRDAAALVQPDASADVPSASCPAAAAAATTTTIDRASASYSAATSTSVSARQTENATSIGAVQRIAPAPAAAEPLHSVNYNVAQRVLPLWEWESHLARTPQKHFHTTAVITAVMSNLIIKEYAMPEQAMPTVYVFSLCVRLSAVEDSSVVQGRVAASGHAKGFQLNVELGDTVLAPMVGVHAAQLKALSVSQDDSDKQQMVQRINILGSTLESCGVCRFTLALRSMDSMVEVLSMQRVQ